jgi:hypothetical protein
MGARQFRNFRMAEPPTGAVYELRSPRISQSQNLVTRIPRKSTQHSSNREIIRTDLSCLLLPFLPRATSNGCGNLHRCTTYSLRLSEVILRFTSPLLVIGAWELVIQSPAQKKYFAAANPFLKGPYVHCPSSYPQSLHFGT